MLCRDPDTWQGATEFMVLRVHLKAEMWPILMEFSLIRFPLQCARWTKFHGKARRTRYMHMASFEGCPQNFEQICTSDVRCGDPRHRAKRISGRCYIAALTSMGRWKYCDRAKQRTRIRGRTIIRNEISQCGKKAMLWPQKRRRFIYLQTSLLRAILPSNGKWKFNKIIMEKVGSKHSYALRCGL